MKDDVIQALLIDPIKGCIVNVNLPRAIDARWRDLLDCEHLDMVQAPFTFHGPHGIWIDDCGLLRKPDHYPQFRILGINGDRPLTGYGLLTSLTEGGRGDVDSVCINTMELATVTQFEDWPKRLNPDDYVTQLLRLYLPWP